MVIHYRSLSASQGQPFLFFAGAQLGGFNGVARNAASPNRSDPPRFLNHMVLEMYVSNTVQGKFLGQSSEWHDVVQLNFFDADVVLVYWRFLVYFCIIVWFIETNDMHCKSWVPSNHPTHGMVTAEIGRVHHVRATLLCTSPFIGTSCCKKSIANNL